MGGPGSGGWDDGAATPLVEERYALDVRATTHVVTLSPRGRGAGVPSDIVRGAHVVTLSPRGAQQHERELHRGHHADVDGLPAGRHTAAVPLLGARDALCTWGLGRSTSCRLTMDSHRGPVSTRVTSCGSCKGHCAGT